MALNLEQVQHNPVLLRAFKTIFCLRQDQVQPAEAKMPSAAVDNDKTSADATTMNGTTKTKMTRNSVDHAKSFEVAVFQFKEDPSEKNLASVEKVLQAR